MANKRKTSFLRRVMRIAQYLCFGAMVIAVLFKIQHWPFIYEMLFTAQAFSLIFWMCAIAEAIMSKVLPAQSKYLLSGALILLMIADLVVFVPLIFLIFQWGYLRLSRNKLYPLVKV